MNANQMNAVNRGVYISDNLPFLQGLNDGCIDLVCIDPPFAKNETFGKKNSKAPDPLKPPLSDKEKATELALLRRWGIKNEQDAAKTGVSKERTFEYAFVMALSQPRKKRSRSRSDPATQPTLLCFPDNAE